MPSPSDLRPDEDGDLLSESDLIGHLSTLFTAGHETTASALTWTLFLLTAAPADFGRPGRRTR